MHHAYFSRLVETYGGGDLYLQLVCLAVSILLHALIAECRHPDKQQLELRADQPQSSPASSSTDAVQFQDLAAAYQLLSSSHLISSANSNNNSFKSGRHNEQAAKSWPSFEAAFATGLLFCEPLLDEAVIHGAHPAEVATL